MEPRADGVPLDAGGAIDRLGFGLRPIDEGLAVGVGTERRLEHVAEVGDELAIFGPHDVFEREDGKVGAAEMGGDRLDGGVQPARIAAEVEDAELGPAITVDLAGHRVVGRHHHRHAVDIGEQAQRLALVGDAVLAADRWPGVVTPAARSASSAASGVLALGGEDHHVVGLEVDSRPGPAWQGKFTRCSPPGVRKSRPSGLDGVEHLAAGDRRRRRDPPVRGSAGNGAADSADAVDNEHAKKAPRLVQALALEQVQVSQLSAKVAAPTIRESAAVSNTPFLLIPGLNSTSDVFGQLAPALWALGPVTVANHTEGDSIA